jgi:glycerol-3-phosphate dehydrogenase
MRRTGRLFFDANSIGLHKKLVLTEFQNYFAWDDKTVKKHQKELEEQLKTATTFE